MGTNFYGWKQTTFLPAFCLINMEEDCDGDPIDNQEIIHVGKVSCGWNFLAQYNNGKYYTNKEEYLNFVKELEILDEYDNSVDFKEFNEILDTWKGKTHESNNSYGIKNIFFGESSELEFSNGNWS